MAESPPIIAAIVMGVFIALFLAAVGVAVYLGKLSRVMGMVIFVSVITLINFGLSSSIGSIDDMDSKKKALISLVSLNSITIAALLFFLGVTTYTNFQKTSIQASYKYIHILIPATVVISIVSLSATAMKQLTKAHSTP